MAYEISLENKNALVTGASRGIGKSIALGFAKAGAKVIIISRTKSELFKTADEIKDLGSIALPIVCDLENMSQLENSINSIVNEFKSIDILANVAGILIPSSIENIRVQDWEKTMKINVLAPCLIAQKIGKIMIDNKIKGSIINTTSEVQDVAEANFGTYNMSKGALKMLTKTIAAEWGEYGIRANNLAPCFVKTELNKPLIDGTGELKGRYEKKLARVPLRRQSVPEDLVGAAIYLASDVSSYVTGQTILVDGGYTCC